MRSEFHIALRYLFAKKKHNVINIISIVSAAGIAIGSMALVLILSVYNGFDNSIREIYESFKADFTISPSTGKTLLIQEEEIAHIESLKGVAAAYPLVEENVFVKYGNKETLAILIGTDTSYLSMYRLREGELSFNKGETNYTIVGLDLARELGIRTRFLTPLKLFFPKKRGEISITNPLESINEQIIYPSALLDDINNTRAKALYVKTDIAKGLTGMSENEFSSIEIFLQTPSDKQTVREKLESIVPDSIVKDKAQQNATLYKMMKAEKLAVYLILFFVIGIISINIFSCLSMLVTDKREDIQTFISMGCSPDMIKRIFHLHGSLISLTGCIAGTSLGILLAILQKEFGIISLPGSYIISAYPVAISITDIAITFIGVSLTGFLISYLPAKKIF